MSRNDNTYLLPNGTLRNRLGVTDQSVLALTEGRLVSGREKMFRDRLPGPPFTFETLKSIHRELFQDVYDWAGQVRTVPLGKREFDHPSSPIQTFTKPDEIEAQAEKAFKALAGQDYLVGSSPAAFAAGATELFADINHIHFARDGNGRSQRLLLTAIGASAGHPLDFNGLTRERMVAISVAAHKGDISGLRRMLDEIMDPRQVSAVRTATNALGQARVPWNDLYIATCREGETYDGSLIGRAGSDFMLRVDQTSETRILIGDVADIPATATTGARLQFVATRFSPPQPLVREMPAASRALSSVLKAMSPPKSEAPAPWAPPPVPMAERLAAFERTIAERANKPAPSSSTAEPEAEPTPRPSSGPKP